MRPMSARDFISKANPISVTNYTDGDIHEMYTFQHDATAQTPALTDYRYIGDDPYNYVYFNCDSLDNQNAETCEVWRIIGVFDVEDENGNWNKSIKIILDKKLDYNLIYAQNNDWTSLRSLYIFLNNDYFNGISTSNSIGLKENVRLIVKDVKNYLGAISYDLDENSSFGTVDRIYNIERGNLLCGSCCSDSSKLYWIGKIGLIYPSDMYMVYGKGIDNLCYNNPNQCNSGNPGSGWLYNSNFYPNEDNQYDITFLSSLYNSTNYVLYGDNFGNIDSEGIWRTEHGMRPTLYLSSSVKLIDGNGSQNNPYKLGYDLLNLNYDSYTKGQTVTYDNQEYYVMSTSEGNKSYIKLLKATPLTASEINAFNTDYTSANGEYPYLENNTCTNGNTANCTTNYDSSNIKNIIDNWSSSYNNDLISINGYKARLVNNIDIMDYFAYERYDASPNDGYRASSDTPSWAYINGSKYWSMTTSEYSNNQIYGVSNTLSSENVYNKLYIRPVINLKKCALNNTCE